MEIIRVEETGSTNTWAAEHDEELQKPSLVYCICQRAGRGQRGNHWESEPGKNITASLIFRPEGISANRQFLLSEAVALAIAAFLKDKGVEAKVKWPNDIYVGDKKICGILVEHMILGKEITRTIAGFGINLNQKDFHGDAPNPVSLKMLTGLEYDLEKSVEELTGYLQTYMEKISEGEKLHKEFSDNLWRGRGGTYPFFDHLREEAIEAEIEDVGKDGILTLKTIDGQRRSYAFKEVEFIL